MYIEPPDEAGRVYPDACGVLLRAKLLTGTVPVDV